MFTIRAERHTCWLILVLCIIGGSLKAEKIIGTRIPSSDFWERIHPYHPLRYSLPDTTPGRFYFGTFQLFRDPVKSWLLIGDGNGQVWTLNEDSCWQKDDTTICFGYNFGAMVLPGPRKYGGYGYWRTTGMLLDYDWNIHEWSALRQSREIPISDAAHNFYDQKDSLLYQLGSYSRNGMIENEVVLTDSLYVLDLRTLQWKTLGRINPELQKMFGMTNGISLSFAFPNSTGALYLEGQVGYLIYIDYKNLTCTFLDNELSTRLERLRRYPGDVVATDYGLLTFERKGFTIIDSISWEALLKNPERVMPLLAPQKTAVQKWLYGSLFGAAVISGFTIWYRRKRKVIRTENPSAGHQQMQEGPEKVDRPSDVIPAAEIDPKLIIADNGRVIFSGKELLSLTSQEKQVIELLISKRRINEELSTNELNEALMIDQRSTDVQKKVRSELVKSINRKFQDAGFSAEAVRRTRQEDDRRVVTYILDENIRS